MNRRCVFFDRDGIVNRPPPEGSYVERLDDFEILPQFLSVIRKVTDSGYASAIVTNQRCIARGITTMAEVDSMHQLLIDTLARDGITLAAVKVCPHDRDEGCECRKPGHGMLMDIAREHDIDLSSSIMVGDHETDITAGRNAGCRTIRIMYGDSETAADFKVEDMAELDSEMENIISELTRE